ncbi:LexA family transcriptional regulator [Pseudomonas syringae]|uniref:Helix-turn-helix n=1 Tax=Pseudomonas syringae TaxID=317 RepID=A0AB38C2H8_PSESX|nr:S24 family peptidase [Pseudomonas syringae]MCK0551419.1 helix-turn-helix domain-containing protein [Pseudomonas syringae pv. aptata]SFI91415.1 Helix-turn-helix [Pseudomonas syringae]SFO61501.1 Helix-turn-helix [Pseudomonas syringae]SFP11061.1 Helix-turn-helix [Pseudomonas syringae]
MKKITRSPSPAAVLFKSKRKALKLSQTALADKVKELLGPQETFTQQTYAAFEAGVAQNTRFALQIAQVLGISMSDLASTHKNPTEPPEPEKSEAVLLGAIEVWDDNTPLDSDEVEVPLLKEVELSAGNGSLAIQQHSTAKLRFGRLTLRRQGIEPAAVICVSVSGSSMEPVLPNGSTVGVDQSKKDIKDGDIYALSHNEHLRVKILYRLPSGGIRMRSFNKEEYPDEEYSQDRIHSEEIKILGRVFWYSVLR